MDHRAFDVEFSVLSKNKTSEILNLYSTRCRQNMIGSEVKGEISVDAILFAITGRV